MGCLKSLLRKGQTLWQLSWVERVLLLQALVLLPLVAFSMKLWGVRVTQNALARISRARKPLSSHTQLPQVLKTTWIVKIASRYTVFWVNCLKESLVLWCLLRCQGITSQLRIGVRRQQGKFEAHAWVEYRNIVLNSSPDASKQFAVLDYQIDARV